MRAFLNSGRPRNEREEKHAEDEEAHGFLPSVPADISGPASDMAAAAAPTYNATSLLRPFVPIKPLINPTVCEFEEFLATLFQAGSLGVGKIGGAYEHRVETRMRETNTYPREWYDATRGQVLVRGILTDAHAILLEQAGIDFMAERELATNR